MKKDKISVHTVHNGFTLAVGSEEYMYFDLEALLGGFIKHVGFKSKEVCDPEALKNLIAAMATWPDASTIANDTLHLMSENKRLADRSISLTNRMHGLNEKIALLNEKVKKLEEENERLFKSCARLTKLLNRNEVKKPVLPVDTDDIHPAIKKEQPNKTHKERVRLETNAKKIKVPYTLNLYKLLTMPLYDTGLKGAVLNKISLGGVYETVGDVVQNPKTHFYASRGCGPISLRQFEQWMIQKNLFFNMDVQSIIDEHLKRMIK